MSKIEKLRNKTKIIEKEVKKRIVTYITAALGLVAALAWNDAIKALISYLFPLNKNSLLVKFIYAVIVTVIVTIFTIYISKLFSRNEKE
ncbi:hypothetical protein J7K86_00035 [bacterium]|nr:hypothetical protein [bacterium]